MRASVFIATSVDGFIARPDGALDWLPSDGVEEHGYTEFMDSVDALVVGRKTFETVLGFGAWPYGTKPVVVLSSVPATSRHRPARCASSWLARPPKWRRGSPPADWSTSI